jgi:hypothetical protein
MVSLPPPNIHVSRVDDMPEDDREKFEVLNKVVTCFVMRAGEPLWEAFVKDFPAKYPGMKLDVYDPAIKATFLTALQTGFFNALSLRIEAITKTLGK